MKHILIRTIIEDDERSRCITLRIPIDDAKAAWDTKGYVSQRMWDYCEDITDKVNELVDANT